MSSKPATPAQAPHSGGVLVSIQYLRALAAAMVLLHHVAWKGAQHGSDPLAWFTFGGAGVDLFFIISGYIMCEATDGRTVDVPRFLKARFFRIIPLYWLLSVAALAAFLLMPDKVNSSGGNTDVLASFVLWPSGDKYLIQNGWTLSYEFFFYGLFALGLAAGRHGYTVTIGLILALVGAGWVLQPQAVGWAFLTNAILLEFAMGIGAFLLLRHGLKPGLAGSLLLMACALTGLFWAGELGPQDNRALSYGLPCLALFMAVRGLEGRTLRFDRSLAGTLGKALGDSSYSMYLAHPFFLVAAVWLLARAGLTHHSSLLIGILFAGSLIAGWCCYRWVEQPLARLINQWREPRSAHAVVPRTRLQPLHDERLRAGVAAHD